MCAQGPSPALDHGTSPAGAVCLVLCLALPDLPPASAAREGTFSGAPPWGQCLHNLLSWGQEVPAESELILTVS